MTTTSESPSTTGLMDFRPGGFNLRDAWFPVIQSDRVGRRVVRRAIHGAPVYLWREQGELRATEDSPAAREWGRRRESEFTGGTGSYPLEERYGYAWVWYGNPEAAALDLIPNVPHIPLDGMPRHMQASVVFDCSYELVCENLLDLTHADFLHSSLTGDSLSDSDEVSVTSTSETVTMTRRAVNRPIPKAQRGLTRGAQTQDLTAKILVHVRSGVCILHGNYEPGMSVRMLHPATPESPTRCRTEVSYNVVNCPALARHIFSLTSHWVGRQDNWALKPQNANYIAPFPHKDLSSRFDRAGLRYRKVLHDLVTRQRQGDYSYLPDGHPSRDVRAEMGVEDGAYA